MADQNMQKIAEKALTIAASLGVASSEVFLSESQNLSVEVRDQKVETMKLAEERGMGIRVIEKGQLGFAYSAELTDSAMDQMVRAAVANSENTAGDKYYQLPSQPLNKYPELELWDENIHHVPVEEKINLAKDIEKEAKAYDSRIKITERCTYSNASYQVAVFNSLGINAQYQGSYCGASAILVAEEKGDSQTGFGFQYKLKYRELDPSFIAREAAQKAIRLLGAQGINTQKVPIIIDPYVATSFLSLISQSLSADAVQKGKSRLTGQTDSQVISSLVSITDHGAMVGGVISAPFDGEGVPCSKNELIKEGLLQGFLHNTYTATKAGIESTGNAVRSSYKSTPEVGTTNLYIEKGRLTPEQLIQPISRGIYLTQVLGMHTANPISGDFSLGAAGLLIENGEVTRPVRGIAIAGNVFDLFNTIDGVGNDLAFFVGKGSPTLRVTGLTVSGN